MTPTLITELRKLHTSSTDEGDKQLLGAFISAHEAQEAAADLADRTTNCNLCPETWPLSLLNDEGDCPNCLIDRMNERRARHRAEFIGW